MNRVLRPQEISLFNKLRQHKVPFMLVGMTAAIIPGANTVTEDIDIWIKDLNSESFYKAVKESGAFYVPAGITGTNPPMLGPQQFSSLVLVTHMHGLGSFDQEIGNTTEFEIDGVKLPVLNINRIIESKQAANREKDKAVLPALKALLAAKT